MRYTYMEKTKKQPVAVVKAPVDENLVQESKNAKSVMAFVFGILSWFETSLLFVLPFSIIGIVNAATAGRVKNGACRGLKTSGLILSIISLVYKIVMPIISAMIFVMVYVAIIVIVVVIILFITFAMTALTGAAVNSMSDYLVMLAALL